MGNEVTRFSDPGGLERTLSEWHAYFASNRPETLAEWKAWRRIQNNKRFLEKHREHEKKRNRGDWSYRLAELPLSDVLNPVYLADLRIKLRNGDPTTFALRPNPTKTIGGGDPLFGLVGPGKFKPGKSASEAIAAKAAQGFKQGRCASC